MRQVKFIVEGGNERSGALRDVSIATVPEMENFNTSMDTAAHTNALDIAEQWANQYVKREFYGSDSAYQEAYKQFITKISWSWVEIST